MKSFRGIFEKVYDFDNLYNAYLNARKGKRFRGEVLKFTENLEENLIDIQNHLIWESYAVGKYRTFYITDPKKRMIMALQFKDRVVQWAIYRQVAPLFDRQFIFDSYGCRDGKGTHKAMERLQYWLKQVERRQDKYYYLKLDVSKFFYSVNHDILIDILGHRIADEKLMTLLTKIINSEDADFGLPQGLIPDDMTYVPTDENSGIPIGNLTSQMFANIYLNELDQFCKHTLKIHYYIRYMDDIIILDDDKKHLANLKDEIENFLHDRLRLRLNNKTAIRPVGMGIEFVGYRVWGSHVKLRKSTVLKMKRRMKELQYLYGEGVIDFENVKGTLASYFGLMKHCNSYNLRCKISEKLVFSRKEK